MVVTVVTYHVVVRGTFGEDIGERRSVRLRQHTHELNAHAVLQPTKHTIFRNCWFRSWRHSEISIRSWNITYLYLPPLRFYMCRGLCLKIKIHRIIILPFVLNGSHIRHLALMERQAATVQEQGDNEYNYLDKRGRMLGAEKTARWGTSWCTLVTKHDSGDQIKEG